jgi:hypothetical protein
MASHKLSVGYCEGRVRSDSNLDAAPNSLGTSARSAYAVQTDPLRLQMDSRQPTSRPRLLYINDVREAMVVSDKGRYVLRGVTLVQLRPPAEFKWTWRRARPSRRLMVMVRPDRSRSHCVTVRLYLRQRRSAKIIPDWNVARTGMSTIYG